MSLKHHFGTSTAWMSAAASGNSLISFVIFIMLSRLLAPEDIGLVAFALIVVELGKILVNAGLSQAIVRHTDWDNRYSATGFYLNLILAALVTLLVIFLAAPLTAQLYDPRAKQLLQVLAIIFFLEGVKAIHEGKLKREFDFRTIALRTVAGSLLAGALGIALALNGFGVWALVWQQIVNQLIVTLVTLYAARWWPGWQFSIIDARTLVRFSTPLTLAQVINNIASKVYEILVGLLLGPAAMGFFRVGGRALFILQDILLKPFEQTLLPALARISDNEARAQNTLRVMRMSAYVTFPVFFGAAALGPEFIRLAFTDKWAESGTVMTWLALGIAPLVIGYQVNAALTASGQTRKVMAIASVAFALNCLIGLVLVRYGIAAAAAGFALRTYLTIFCNMLFFKQAFHVSILRQLGSVAPTFSAALVMFILVLAGKWLMPPHWSPGVQIALLGSAGACCYIAIMSLVFRQETRHILGESAALAPARAKPVINKLQQWLGFI